MSVESIITENLDVWTSAVKTKSTSGRGSSNKLELYGIKKLKELILELAIRGKLVPQDLDDEPAAELLLKIETKNNQLVESGKIPKKKKLPPPRKTDLKFEIPNTWTFACLNQLISISSGKNLTSSKMNSEGGVPVFGGNGITGYHDTPNVNKRTLVIGRVGYYCGSIHITPCEAWVTDNAFITTFAEEYIDINFLSLLLNTTNLKENDNATAQPVISGRKIYPIVVPLPPYNEQIRIVTKVTELMALCDQLESQTEASIEAHQTLVKSLLETLTNAKDADELNESWQRISAYFDVLFTTEESIDQLKQTILQLAVMGKLVKQDPNDEPASKLLERIEVEKVQLIKDKKIKKQTELKEVNESDFPFSTPEGWAVVRLGALIPQFQNGVSSRGDKKGKETIVLRLADIKDWRISENDTRRLIINEETIEKYLLKKGDTLIIRVNGSSEIVGRFITVEKVTDAIYCDHFIRMRFPIPCIEPNYLAILGSSRLVRDKISDLFISTAGQKTVNQTHISSLTLSIPPIMEQKRISERVRYLVAICDELKSKLQTVQRTISNVADSVKANY